jgi:formate/nitrite transporter
MNFVGALVWSSAIAYASDSLEDLGKADFAVQVALKKANQTFIHIFLKGIAANFMVCLGVWQATCAEEVAGKILALWFPITAFVVMGFEHSIANQFFLPLGMMFGADISYGDMFKALLAATLGNVVGGGIFVGAVYWYVYESMARNYRVLSRIRESLKSRRSILLTKEESRHEN